ncbi:MAG: family 10 glycosylhydrolase [Planctomycetota bacterium]
MERDDWRRDNINRFVRDVNELVHRRRPGGLFTISPFGIWRPGHPPEITGFDAYAGLYADSKRWMQAGWCDALIPQLYWKISSKGQAFEPLMNWWADQNTQRRHLWAGLYLTRIKPADDESASWEPAEIADQIAIVERTPRVGGFTLFSMIGMLENRRGVSDVLAVGPLSGPALVPESPWLVSPGPVAPGCTAERSGRAVRLSISPGAGSVATRRYVAAFDRAVDAARPGWVIPGGDRPVRTTLIPSIPVPIGTPMTVTPIGPNGITGSATMVRT